jgi:hypothetical protein
MKKLIHKFKELPLHRKVQFFTAIVLTIALSAAIYSYAWFSSQKKAAELFKIEYPNALYINAAHREDRVHFAVDGIDVNSYLKDSEGELIRDENNEPIPITKRAVFSVSGSNTNHFTLQMAHTNNNLFKYKIYEAKEYKTLAEASTLPHEENEEASTVASEDIIEYQIHTQTDHPENDMVFPGDTVSANDLLYYVKGDPVDDEYKNMPEEPTAITDTNDKYYNKTYGNNTNVDPYSVPSYWQATIPSDQDSNKQFCKYFVLEITWKESEQNSQTSKETDLVYFTVKRID